MLLNVVQVNSALFNHFPKTKRLVADLSDVRVNFQPLYDDACDVGFALRNEKTGNVTCWVLSNEEERDNEGELIALKLHPTYESVRANPALQGYTMALLND